MRTKRMISSAPLNDKAPILKYREMSEQQELARLRFEQKRGSDRQALAVRLASLLHDRAARLESTASKFEVPVGANKAFLKHVAATGAFRSLLKAISQGDTERDLAHELAACLVELDRTYLHIIQLYHASIWNLLRTWTQKYRHISGPQQGAEIKTRLDQLAQKVNTQGKILFKKSDTLEGCEHNQVVFDTLYEELESIASRFAEVSNRGRQLEMEIGARQRRFFLSFAVAPAVLFFAQFALLHTEASQLVLMLLLVPVVLMWVWASFRMLKVTIRDPDGEYEAPIAKPDTKAKPSLAIST